MNENRGITITVTEDAAEWLDRLSVEPVPEAERRAFADWLLRSPVHVEEFLRLSGLRAELQQSLQSNPEWLALLLHQANTNVVNLQVKPSTPTVTKVVSRWRVHRGRIAAAVATMAILTGILIGIDRQWVAGGNFLEITTELGEQRSVVLDDGSVLELNTDSQVQIRLDSTSRNVDLLRGEALFEVAKDSSRPFRVFSGAVLVEAIGTRFNVYRQDEQTVVTVVEGRVNVSPNGTEAAVKNVDTVGIGVPYVGQIGVVELAAGNQVTVRLGGLVEKPIVANLERSTAWTDRRLIFDNEPLTRVVNEFNRYNRARLVIDDLELGSRQITGVFDANNPEDFLALLQSLKPIEVQRRTNGVRHIRRVTDTSTR